MDSIDCNENENSTFTRGDKKISYKDHIKERFKIDSPYKEKCVIKTKNEAAFLPQHLQITATNKMLGNRVKEILDYKQKIKPQDRINRIEQFLKKLNIRSYNLSFETKVVPIQTTAQQLPTVYLQIKTADGDKQYPTIGVPQDTFSKNYRKINGFNNKYNKEKMRPITLGILYPFDAKRLVNNLLDNLL